MKTYLGLTAAITLWLLMASWVVLQAATPPPSIADIDPTDAVASAVDKALMALPSYGTLEEAGIAGIARDYQCSHVYECGGLIAQRPDGRFVVGPVHSDYEGDSVSMPSVVPKDWKRAGTHHTHPCMPTSHEVPFFSPQDLMGDISGHTIGFMGDLCTGEVHEFNPAKDAPADTPLPGDKDTWSTKGRIIGKIAVDGVSTEPKTGL
jgi:hypothetical protein